MPLEAKECQANVMSTVEVMPYCCLHISLVYFPSMKANFRHSLRKYNQTYLLDVNNGISDIYI
jgi:hypothetical protein